MEVWRLFEDHQKGTPLFSTFRTLFAFLLPLALFFDDQPFLSLQGILVQPFVGKALLRWYSSMKVVRVQPMLFLQLMQQAFLCETLLFLVGISIKLLKAR